MKRLLHGAALAATVICQAPAGAQPIYTCGQGTVRRMEALTETVTPETITIRPGTDDASAIEMQEGKQRRASVVAVELGDRLYVSQVSSHESGTPEPPRLEPGDRIDICVAGAQMILVRPDAGYRLPVGNGTVKPGTKGSFRSPLS